MGLSRELLVHVGVQEFRLYRLWEDCGEVVVGCSYASQISLALTTANTHSIVTAFSRPVYYENFLTTTLTPDLN